MVKAVENPTAPLVETVADRARRTRPGSEYGITRNARGGSHYWQVNLKRQRRHFCRIFFDSVYGDAETALAEARDYRNALMAAFAPHTTAEAARRTPKKEGGMRGVHEMRDHSGNVTGYRAVMSTRGKMKQPVFSVVRYGLNGAQRRAEAQRESWLAERKPHFMVQNSAAMQQAMQAFPGNLVYAAHEAAGNASEDDVDLRLKAINTVFDVRRPQIFAVSVRHYDEKRLILRVGNGGVPVVAETMSLNYAKIGRQEALRRIGEQAAVYIGKFFGQERSERFRRDHAAAFAEENFDPAKGIEIRERP